MNFDPTNSNAMVTYSRDTEPFALTIEDEKEIDVQRIRLQACAFVNSHMFIYAANEYLKLFEINLNTLDDSVRLSEAVSRYLDKNALCQEFTMGELNYIKYACKIVADHKSQPSGKSLKEVKKIRASKLLEHLNLKTKDLIQKMNNVTANTLLLLQSQNDENSLFHKDFVPTDILQVITLKSHEIIDDLMETHIDIGGSQEKFFPNKFHFNP